MLYHLDPHEWPWCQGHELVTYISWSIDFCLLSWRLFDVWTSYLGIMSQSDPMFYLKINVGHCDLYSMVQWFCLISWRLFAVWTSYCGIMSRYGTTFDLKINVGLCDLYFMVQRFCLISWRLLDIWTPYFGIMSQYDQMFDLKIFVGHWPIFHGPVILPYILKTICCMNIILWDYESVWHNIWPQNKCRSLWPIFHGPEILPYILKTIGYMNTILWDYESVWPNVWPQNICRTLTYISWSSDFALYLENYSVAEHHTLGLWVSITRHLTSK